MRPSTGALLLIAVAAALAVDAGPPEGGGRQRDDVLARLVEGRAAGAGGARHLDEIDGIEELLAALPDELRRNFTLVHRSRSPHGGLGDRDAASIDSAHPRVILFSDDARVVLAFTGAPGQPGWDVVEAIRFVDERAAFELSRHVLPAAARRDPELARARRDNGQVDPPECLRCHGADPRPIFDSYPLWPGFYGGVSDTFPGDDADLARYREFLARQKDAPGGVYARLTWPSGTSVPPYTDPGAYDPEVNQVSPDALRLQPNARLGIALAELNRKRIARKLAASPAFPRLRHGILAVLLGCVAPPLTREALEEVQSAVARESGTRVERVGYRPQGGRSRVLGLMERGMYGNVANILYVARALSLSPRDFSLAFEDGALAFYDGILGSEHEGRSHFLTEDIALELLRQLVRDEPRFGPHFVTRRPFTASGYPFGEKLDLRAALGACSALVERQREMGAELPAVAGNLVAATAAFAPSPEPEDERDDGVVETASGAPYSRCVRCHEGDEAVRVGRPIPLSSPALLRERLLQPCASSSRTLFAEIRARMAASGPERMPPHDLRPTSVEQDAMRVYLESVVAGPNPGRH